jgi:hypothetical protein
MGTVMPICDNCREMNHTESPHLVYRISSATWQLRFKVDWTMLLLGMIVGFLVLAAARHASFLLKDPSQWVNLDVLLSYAQITNHHSGIALSTTNTLTVRKIRGGWEARLE